MAFLKIDSRKCKWSVFLAATLVFLHVSSSWAVEQKLDRLSLSEFQQQFERAFINSNSMQMGVLASGHRDFLRSSINNILEAHLRFTLEARSSQAQDALSQAFALAEFVHQLSNDDFPLKQIQRQANWSKADLRLKMQAVALLSQCEAAFNQGLYEKVLPLGAAIVEIHQSLGSNSSDGTEIHLLGIAERKLAHYEKAISWHEKAFAMAEQNNDRPGKGRALIDLADVYERQKDYTRAKKLYRQALALFEIPEDWRLAGLALRQLGDIYVENGEFEEAYQAYGQAVRYAEEMDDATLNAEYHDYSGYFYRRLGNYAKAIKAHNRALDYAQSIPDETIKARALARAYNHLGLCLEKQAEVELKNGNPGPAEKLLLRGIESEKQALHFAGEVKERWRLGYILRALASLYRHLGALEPSNHALENYNQSLTYARQALALGKEMQEKEWQGQALHAIGMTLSRMNRDQEGLDVLKKAIEMWDAIGDVYLKGQAHRIIAYNFHEKAGRLDEALASYNAALNNFRSLRAAEYVAAVHLSKGMLYEKKEDFSNAQTEYLASIDSLEGIRKQLTSEEHKLAFFERRLDPYEALIRLLIKKYRQTAEIKYGQMAVEISERSRSRATLDLIQEASGKIRAGVDDATLEREQFLRSQIYIVTGELLHKREAHQIDELRNRLESLELDYNHLLRNLEKQYPAYAELKHPKNLNFNEIKNVLKDGEILLEYFVGEQETFLFVLTREKLKAIIPLSIGKKELAEKITALRKPFEELKKSPGLSTLKKFDLKLGNELYEILLKPAEDFLPGAREVMLAPHGPLFYLPFELLITKIDARKLPENIILGEFETVSYVLESYPPINYTLSASMLNPQLKKHKEDLACQGKLLAFGNPTAMRDANDQASLQTRNGPVKLSPLPYAEKEVEGVADIYGQQAKIYVREKATKEQFIKDAPHYPHILLSTHGIFDESNPMYSALVFAPTEPNGDLVRLEAYELFNLDLNADLVTLSACEVGLGEIIDGEGLVGMSKAFLYSGASSLIVSLWSVYDKSTSQLVMDFYREIVKEPARKAHFLRESKLQILKTRQKLSSGEKEFSYAHPFFWAPFILLKGP